MPDIDLTNPIFSDEEKARLHLHRWQDNKEFATHSTLPEDLEYAILIPSAARGFSNAFRWFCGEHNIVVPDVPDYPGSEQLL